MTQEEKARRYDEAIERAREFVSKDNVEVAEYIFPELAEYEDKRIREKLIDTFNFYDPAMNSPFLLGIHKKNILAWLEKQGEQKHMKNIVETWKEMRLEVYAQASGNRHEPNYSDDTTKMFSLNDIDEIIEKISEQQLADKVKPKFKVGDWIVTHKNQVYQITSIEGTTYRFNNESTYWEICYCDELCHLWSIKDAKDGDVLNDENSIFIFKDLLSDNSVVTYCDYDTDCGESDAFCPLAMDLMCSKITPATKEQRDLLFQKIEEAGYMWDANKKELKKIEQKSTDKDETKFHEGECISNNKKDEPKEDNRTVTERIKTFKDACDALGDEHPFVTQYRLTAAAYKGDPMTEDFIAYLKLRIIVTALNEGWKPKFETDEHRYYPWFFLYTKEQYDKLDDEEKGRCVLRSGFGAVTNFGFIYCNASYDPSFSNTFFGSRLAFRTRELAEYAGRQFLDEWADFQFR